MTTVETRPLGLRRRRRHVMAALLVALAVSSTPMLSAKESSRDATIVSTDAFLAHHPDIRYRLLGLKAYERRQFQDALRHFQRASRFADKPSQGMVAEMLWNGDGAPADRVAATAWMSLAAERGYTMMVLRRDTFLAALDADERRRTEAALAALTSELGDAVAQPRLERLLRQELRNVTGSRTGFVGAVQILLPSPTGMLQVDGSQFYQDKFWKPAEYWQWQDRAWKPEPKGSVEIGPIDASPSHR
jgi:uncharacterized protein